MAKGKKTRAADESDAELPTGAPIFTGGGGGGSGTGNGTTGTGTGPETTGRFMVIFKPGARETAAVRSVLNKVGGLKNVTGTSDFASAAFSAEALDDAETMHFELSGMVRVSADAVQSMATSLSADADSPILAIEPELICYPSPSFFAPGSAPGAAAFPVVPNAPALPITSPADYLRGYQEAVNHLAERLAGLGGMVGVAGAGPLAAPSAVFEDNAQFTWGLQATGVHTSPFTGQGVRVAVLDTGFDTSHIDFAGRAVVTHSTTGFPVQDAFGHGTHCIGTALGPRNPASGVRRYGIAHGAQIFACRVFDNTQPPNGPGASTSSVVAGIEWARANGCQIVSLSLGARGVSQQFQQYHIPILLALQNGCLVICAAGNNAKRSQGFPGVVEPPANADAAMAIAAVDNQLQIANFSGRSTTVGIGGLGGIINVSGPGVAVFSSVPGGGHQPFNGTSMATPHVAGIAALWCQATGDKGATLWNRLVQNVTPLGVSSADGGAGLVRAPQSPT